MIDKRADALSGGQRQRGRHRPRAAAEPAHPAGGRTDGEPRSEDLAPDHAAV
ncbi:MAG: hypothetical protein MZW92_39635 [Comamonadaceae bacterium]|nr:hypothetical protein [Comamonadaceae bacterium]